MRILLNIKKKASRFFAGKMAATCILMVLFAVTVFAVSDTIYTVYIHDGSTVQMVNTIHTTAEEILQEMEISYAPDDEILFSYDSDSRVGEITINRAFDVVVQDGANEPFMVRVTGGTVYDVLESQNIHLNQNDILSVNMYEEVYEGCAIVIDRITYNTTRVEEAIEHEVIQKPTPLLKNGSTRVSIQGSDGSKIITTQEKYVNGELVETYVLGEEITKQPQSSLVLVGDSSAVVSTLQMDQSFPSSYVRVIENAVCTGYSARSGAWGASGNTLSAGHVAVDPNEIPYGSLLYITSKDGSFVYGYAIASDTGVALMDGRIDVDLFYDTYRESALNGLRTLDVYVVREGY